MVQLFIYNFLYSSFPQANWFLASNFLQEGK